MNWEPQIIVLYIGMLATMAGVLFQWLSLRRQAKKDLVESKLSESESDRAEAEAAKSLTEGSKALAEGVNQIIPHYERKIAALQSALADMTKRQDRSDARQREMEYGLGILINQIRQASLVPEWTLDKLPS